MFKMRAHSQTLTRTPIQRERDHVAFVRLCRGVGAKTTKWVKIIFINAFFVPLKMCAFDSLSCIEWYSSERVLKERINSTRKKNNNYDSCRFYYFRCCYCCFVFVVALSQYILFLPLHKNLCSLVTCPNVCNVHKVQADMSVHNRRHTVKRNEAKFN